MDQRWIETIRADGLGTFVSTLLCGEDSITVQNCISTGLEPYYAASAHGAGGESVLEIRGRRRPCYDFLTLETYS